MRSGSSAQMTSKRGLIVLAVHLARSSWVTKSHVREYAENVKIYSQASTSFIFRRAVNGRS